jgi:anti-sigma regulatory factor (Ser/Thr protein kinase)
MKVALGGEVIRVEIADHGPGFEPPTDAGGNERDRGWGLFFVAQLATRWGVEDGDPGCVWFEIDRTPGEEAAGQTAA